MSEVAQRAKISYERKPGTLHSFFALKFHEGDEDRAKVEAIESALNKAGVEITLMARDVEKWGEAYIPEGKALMRDYAFPAMMQCDCNIIEFSKKRCWAWYEWWILLRHRQTNLCYSKNKQRHFHNNGKYCNRNYFL